MTKLKQGTLFNGMAYIIRNRESWDKPTRWGIRYEPITFLGKMLVIHLGYYQINIYSHNCPTPKQFYYRSKYKLQKWYGDKKTTITHWFKYWFSTKPVYYSLFSRDCDCVESTSYGVCKNYREYYDWMHDPDAWDWVEGETRVNIVSKWEYEEYGDRTYTRDRIMEAFEDGRGTHINI